MKGKSFQILYNVVVKGDVSDAVREQGLLFLSLYNVFPAFLWEATAPPDLKLSDDGSKKSRKSSLKTPGPGPSTLKYFLCCSSTKCPHVTSNLDFSIVLN